MRSGVVLMLILQFKENGKGLRNLIMYFAVVILTLGTLSTDDGDAKHFTIDFRICLDLLSSPVYRSQNVPKLNM